MRISDRNQVEYMYYEKPMCSKKTVQIGSSKEENTKMKILSNDLMRRFLNSSEHLCKEEKIRIVNGYGENF